MQGSRLRVASHFPERAEPERQKKESGRISGPIKAWSHPAPSVALFRRRKYGSFRMSVVAAFL